MNISKQKHACWSEMYVDQNSCWGFLSLFLIWEQRIVKKKKKKLQVLFTHRILKCLFSSESLFHVAVVPVVLIYF